MEVFRNMSTFFSRSKGSVRFSNGLDNSVIYSYHIKFLRILLLLQVFFGFVIRLHIEETKKLRKFTSSLCSSDLQISICIQEARASEFFEKKKSLKKFHSMVFLCFGSQFSWKITIYEHEVWKSCIMKLLIIQHAHDELRTSFRSTHNSIYWYSEHFFFYSCVSWFRNTHYS